MTTAPAEVPAGDVEVVLDLREADLGLTTAQAYGELWQQLEPTLLGRPLRTGAPFRWESQTGDIVLEVVRCGPGVTVVREDTCFDVVAVRERPDLTRTACAACTGGGRMAYGPFTCELCEKQGRPARLCDDHVVLLDGALTATCVAHRPPCKECGRPASFRCAGPQCGTTEAWCDAHRHPHPADPDLDYCPACHRRQFPVCEQEGCRGAGRVRCDWADPAGTPCGRQVCPRHVHRWQVYGHEKVGLGLCREHHHAPRAAAPPELVRQIVATAARRRGGPRVSLALLGHNLRNTGHGQLAVDYRAIHALLRRLADSSGHDNKARRLAEHVRRAEPDWQRELTRLGDTATEGRRLFERLLALVREQETGRAEIADALRFVEYKAPRMRDGVAERRGLLFVDLPQALRGRFIGAKGVHAARYRQALGVDVRFEGDRSRR
ncbi:hypothetical protein [Streptomyces collinus]|uniref:hypothetical protein n=1 Tax=Streptomyces collinus TaxID=42684 RepID=UPI0033294233